VNSISWRRPDRGVECYERLKGKGPTGAAYFLPLSTGITSHGTAADIILQFIADQERGWEKLKGKRIALAGEETCLRSDVPAGHASRRRAKGDVATHPTEPPRLRVAMGLGRNELDRHQGGGLGGKACFPRVGRHRRVYKRLPFARVKITHPPRARSATKNSVMKYALRKSPYPGGRAGISACGELSSLRCLERQRSMALSH
jgi:hypothetical protein